MLRIHEGGNGVKKVENHWLRCIYELYIFSTVSNLVHSPLLSIDVGNSGSILDNRLLKHRFESL